MRRIDEDWEGGDNLPDCCSRKVQCQGAINEAINEIITGGLKIQKGISDTKHDPCPVEGTMEEKEMIPDEWNSQREAGNTQQNLGPVEEAM